MAGKKQKSIAAQSRERLEQEALALARGIRGSGQSKTETRAIARGIQKGIALYKSQEKARARERDKARKRREQEQPAERTGSSAQEAQGRGTAVQRVLAGLGVFWTLIVLLVVGVDTVRFASWDGTSSGMPGDRGLVFHGLLLDTHLTCPSGMLHLEIAGMALATRAPRDAGRASAMCGDRPGQ